MKRLTVALVALLLVAVGVWIFAYRGAFKRKDFQTVSIVRVDMSNNVISSAPELALPWGKNEESDRFIKLVSRSHSELAKFICVYRVNVLYKGSPKTICVNSNHFNIDGASYEASGNLEDLVSRAYNDAERSAPSSPR